MKRIPNELRPCVPIVIDSQPSSAARRAMVSAGIAFRLLEFETAAGCLQPLGCRVEDRACALGGDLMDALRGHVDFRTRCSCSASAGRSARAVPPSARSAPAAPRNRAPAGQSPNRRSPPGFCASVSPDLPLAALTAVIAAVYFDHRRRGLVRIPGLRLGNRSLAGSAMFGPGASTTRIRSAIEPKSARKCTELFSTSTA